MLMPPFTATPHIRHYTNIQQEYAVAQLVEVAGSIPCGVIDYVCSTQPVTEMNTRNICREVKVANA
jgi:hypothetical protein